MNAHILAGELANQHISKVSQECRDAVRERFGGESRVVIELIRAFGAIRGICRCPSAEQYEKDIHTIGTAGCSDIEDALEYSGFSEREAHDWLERADEMNYHILCGGEFGYGEYWCVNHEHYCDDTIEVRVGSRNAEIWCRELSASYAFYCEISDEWYANHSYDAALTVDGRTICSQIADRFDYYEIRDGEYTNEPESIIPKYHEGDRAWSETEANSSSEAFYGIEVELDFPSESREDFYEEHLADSEDFCGEQDCSLDDEIGMETVTRPFALKELQEKGNSVERLFANLQAAGACAGSDSYGIHITSNVQRLKEDHVERLRNAVCSMQKLSEFVGGRAETRFARFRVDDDKFVAANMRDNGACEFRFFKATAEYPVLVSYIEYLEAVTAFTAFCDKMQPKEDEFLTWIVGQDSWFALKARLAGYAKFTECVEATLRQACFDFA